MEAPTFNLQSVNECNPRCTFACCFALVQAGPMEYFHHLPYLLYFPPRKLCPLCTVQLETLVTSEQCAVGWVCWELDSVLIMGPFQTETFWVYGNKSAAGAESGSVYLGMFEVIPLPGCFSVLPAKCCSCCRMCLRVN